MGEQGKASLYIIVVTITISISEPQSLAHQKNIVGWKTSYPF